MSDRENSWLYLEKNHIKRKKWENGGASRSLNSFIGRKNPNPPKLAENRTSIENFEVKSFFWGKNTSFFSSWIEDIVACLKRIRRLQRNPSTISIWPNMKIYSNGKTRFFSAQTRNKRTLGWFKNKAGTVKVNDSSLFGSIRCKRNTRWQHISQMKERSF